MQNPQVVASKLAMLLPFQVFIIIIIITIFCHQQPLGFIYHTKFAGCCLKIGRVMDILVSIKWPWSLLLSIPSVSLSSIFRCYLDQLPWKIWISLVENWVSYGHSALDKMFIIIIIILFNWLNIFFGVINSNFH